MTSIVSSIMIAALMSQTPAPAAGRLATMKQTMAAYQLRSVGDPEVVGRLLPEPVLRFTNTVGDTRDGAVFLWLGAEDRPDAAAQIFERRDGTWILELVSLSPALLTATGAAGHEWNPAEPGVRFHPVPGAPKPADTEARRSLQMRTMTRDFIVEDDFQNRTWQPLRLLSKPFARYGKPGSEVIDGALFAYVLTTDPEAYLMLEARNGKTGPEWQYAFAPSTVYNVKGKVKGLEVWNKPHRHSSYWKKPNMTFHVHIINQGE